MINQGVKSFICFLAAWLFINVVPVNAAIIPNISLPDEEVLELLESGPDFPLVYPNGSKGYDFYFQSHFEELVERLYKI